MYRPKAKLRKPRLRINNILLVMRRKLSSKRRIPGRGKKRDFKRKGKFWTYIVECKDGTFYTGYTPDVKKRVALHNKGKGAKYTRDRRPVKLVWRKEYRYFKPAFITEKRIKRLTRRQKEALVNGRRLDKVFLDAGK